MIDFNPSAELIDVDIPDTAPQALELERVKEAEALVRTMVKAEIESQSAGLEARAKAVLESAEATAGKILALMGSMKPKVVGIKINDMAPIVLKGRPHASFPRLAEEIEIQRKSGQNLNVAMTGPRGSGKTTLAKQYAEGLKVPFHFISVQRGMSPAEFFGRWAPNGEFVEAPLWKALDKPGVYLLDEFDRGDANTMCVLNSITANGIAVNPYTGQYKVRHPEFVILAAMNTTGRGATADYTAAERLDAATLDRFTLTFVNYDTELEAELCPFPELLGRLHAARKALENGKSKEVIGTRAIQRASAYQRAGLPEREIFTRILEGWDENAKRLSGLLAA